MRLLGYDRKQEKKEEEPMAKDKKKTVKFKVNGDGLPPTRTGWGVALRTAVPIEVPPKSSSVINLQTTCEQPLLLVSLPTIRACDQSGDIVVPGQSITLVLRNEEARPLTIESRQVVLYAIPLGGEDFDVETE